MRLRLHRMDEVGKLHRVLDEEHRDVVADDVEITFVRIELDREAAHVARGVLRTAFARDRREAHEDRRPFALLAKRRGDREVRQRFVGLEESVRAAAARVHDALRNAFVIEMRDLLAQDEILEQRRATQPRLERALVVGDGNALVRREALSVRADAHA